MKQTTAPSHWKPGGREKRLAVYLLVLLAVAAWKFLPRPWHPSVTLKTPHFTIYSSATSAQTEATANALELLSEAYSNRLGGLPQFEIDHLSLKVKLFRDREQFRRINPGLGWAEAFYREPYCRAYFSAEEANPYHWMLHESVHQLNRQVAHLRLEKWLEEGLAAYFSTSRLEPTRLAVGQVDPDTYPVWWIHEMATTTNLSENIRNGSVIPLRAIITNHGGPNLNEEFNLYYLHWWTLTHFIFESPQYRQHAWDLARRGGGLEAFEQTIGPVEKVQSEWHRHVCGLKTALPESNGASRTSQRAAKPR